MISNNKCKVMVYITKEMNERADKFANELGVSKSALFQLALAEYMSARTATMDILKESFNGILKKALDEGQLDEEKLKEALKV